MLDICALPVNTGSCNGNVTRWYFNKKEGKCQQFIYSGCDANGNNFETLSECLCSCGKITFHYLECTVTCIHV